MQGVLNIDAGTAMRLWQRMSVMICFRASEMEAGFVSSQSIPIVFENLRTASVSILGCYVQRMTRPTHTSLRSTSQPMSKL